MKGGYQILILTALILAVGTETAITDSYTLDQLLGLTDFLNKDGLVDKQLKPILLITKDSAGFVSITNPEANKLLIDGYISGKHIQLNIVYTSSIDDYGNTVYAISSAKYLYDAALEFENIVDKDGHNRFIEGDIEIDEYSGIEKTYGKWSLSGSHFLIVLAISIEDTTTPNQRRCCLINVPQWVLDKIYDITGYIVVSNSFTGYDVNFNTQTIIANLLKQNNQLKINYGNEVAVTGKKFFRLNFDLLIDNE